MKPTNSNPRNGRPLPMLCGGCGGQLTKDYCVPCSVKLLYDLSKMLERNEEETRKRLWLSRLGFALCRASRYLPGFDTTSINQAIKDAKSPSSLDTNATTDVNRQGGNHAK
jgi:hypothetical protein